MAVGFESVREAFIDVVRGQDGTGAATAIWHDGRWVADLWGGWTDSARTLPWQRDSIVMPYSVTKAFAATGALVLVDRGVLDLDDPVQQHWPELRTAAASSVTAEAVQSADQSAFTAALTTLDAD